jgi:hypothetical protein
MVRKRRAATFWLPVVRWRVLGWLGLRTARLSSGLGLPSSARKSGTSFPIMRCFRVVQPALQTLVAATYGMRSYGNQRTRSDRRNPDRSTPGRTWSVGACPADSFHRPRGADPGHRLVCVISDLSIGNSRSPPLQCGGRKREQERNCLVRDASNFPKPRLPCRTGATIRPAGNPARGNLLGLSIRCVRRFGPGSGTLGSSAPRPVERIWRGRKPVLSRW